jgi:hypothetical protein
VDPAVKMANRPPAIGLGGIAGPSRIQEESNKNSIHIISLRTAEEAPMLDKTGLETKVDTAESGLVKLFWIR